MMIRRRTARIFVLLLPGCVVYILRLRHMIGELDKGMMTTTTATITTIITTSDERRRRTMTRSLLPSCHPHWKVAMSSSSSSSYSSKKKKKTKKGGSNDPILKWSDANTTLPIRRIYFYHVRKAGGTMIRKYLKKVASHYGVHLRVMEYGHASIEEEVGSRHDTFYVTNVRDPVERSVSHFKYDARWGCHNLVKNESFVPTSHNANPFESWNSTGGFEVSRCDVPFSFVSCAVNCHVQAFSGMGCTADGWRTEYNVAWDRLLRYNMILVYSKFDDPLYVHAVEEYFGGVKGFNVPSSMYCGEEARMANRKVPLRVSFEHVLRLTRYNEMDNRLYRDLVTSCFDEVEGRGGDEAAAGAGGGFRYSFPRVNSSRFVAQKNRTVVD